MPRLEQIDVADLTRGKTQRIALQIAFGLACALLMIGIRTLVDMVAPASGPFALVYPTVLIATLFGRWLAGAAAWFVSFFWAWLFVLPPVGSLQLLIPTDLYRVLINAASCLVMIVLAEIFRRAVRDAAAVRDAEIERGIVLMQELEHRTKNNFALVVSLLQLQKRRLREPEAIDAVEQAIGRVHSFAKAYENLSTTRAEGMPVPLHDYLRDVADRFGDGAFEDNVTIAVRSHEAHFPRPIAVAIGLFVNEALTNCAKYSFPDGQDGRIDVAFDQDDTGWTLTVEDDGVGLIDSAPDAAGDEGSGLGAGLMKAFAQQANADYTIEPVAKGAKVQLRHAAA